MSVAPTILVIFSIK